LLDYSVGAESAVTARIKHVVQPDHTDTASAASGESDLEKEWDRLEIVHKVPENQVNKIAPPREISRCKCAPRRDARRDDA
jgi:hypothetical protein